MVDGRMVDGRADGRRARGWSRLTSRLLETLPDGRGSEGRGGRSHACPMPPLGVFRSPLVRFTSITTCTSGEGRPGLGEEDLATAIATPGPTGLDRDGGRVDTRGKTPSGAVAAAEACRRSAPPNGDWASGKRCQASIGGWLVRRTWPFPVGGMLVGRNPATPKNRLISNRNGSPPGTRCASLPQAKDAPEAPAGPWGRPELF